MIQPRVTPVDEPRRFDAHELFFSFTDPRGVIRYGNTVFTRVSAYEQEQLLGQPHNLIRHPDMPRCVFKLLWDYIEAGKTIAAYVKNLAADGRYYWVLAAVMPCRDGYLSVRLKPASKLFKAAQAVYEKTLAVESRVEEQSGKKAAIEQSLPHLTGLIQEAGFETYDDFMRAALREELGARADFTDQLEAPAVDRGSPLAELLGVLLTTHDHLGEVFRSLGVFESLSERLTEKQEKLQELAPSLSFLSLNTEISASQLGDEGAVLAVVSKNLGERSKEADRAIAELMAQIGPVCRAARAVAFDVEIAQLEAEVCANFAVELMTHGHAGPPSLVTDSLDTLIQELARRVRHMLAALGTLHVDIARLERTVRTLLGQIEQMRAAHINGKIDIASRPNAKSFEAIFEHVAQIVAEASNDCGDVIDVLVTTEERLSTLLRVERTLEQQLTGVEAMTAEVVAV